MSSDKPSIPGDQTRVSVVVGVPPEIAFRIFTEEIDLWWRRGPKYRAAGARAGSFYMEPRVGGRLVESFESGSEMKIVEAGKITAWEPPSRLVFDWRAVNFSAEENTEVEVTFQKSSSGTLVTVTHRGWSRIRTDHPVRHRLETASFIRMIGLWWGDLMSSMREYSAGSRHVQIEQ
ncbi:MAG TPA: SRPBCC domain-containing protein [Terriglobia bacterium]|nr:SRPBCC domain-containing protein [Terriglobia bacterium]